MGKGDEEHESITWYRQGTGPPAKAGREGERVCGWWRQEERGRDPWTGEPWVRQGPDCTGQGWKRGVKRWGKPDTGSRKELLGNPSRVGKRRRAVQANMRGRRPGGRSLRSREKLGEEKRVQAEREAASTSERWRAIGDSSGGREKGNERSRKKVGRNCGAEGLDKSVIVKKSAESRVRAVTN